MNCHLIGLSPPQIEALLKTPSLASGLVRVSEHDETAPFLRKAMERMPPDQKASFEAQQQTSQMEIDACRARLTGIGPFEHPLNLEKSWHILHYVFTGRGTPAIKKAWHYLLTRRVSAAYDVGDTLMNGEALGEDVGYGPPSLQDEKKTDAFSRFLDAQDVVRLQARVNVRKMERLGIYSMPFGPGIDAESEVRTEVATYFPLLRDYVAKTSERRGGLLIWLS
jgi:Domain of unknown function (DUF1877)